MSSSSAHEAARGAGDGTGCCGCGACDTCCPGCHCCHTFSSSRLIANVSKYFWSLNPL